MISPSAKRRTSLSRQHGMTVIELMLAVVVLAVGLSGLLGMIMAAINTNNNNKLDTTATMVAQAVLEQALAQPADRALPTSIVDCSGTTRTVGTVGAAAPGNGALINTATGGIDFTQNLGDISANYRMTYVGCGAASQQPTFDVRWNVTSISANTRLVTVSVRERNYSTGGLVFSPPVTLRSIGGV